MALHPLEPLSGDEFRRTAEILRRDHDVTQSWRFAAIELKEPAKSQVKAWKAGDPVPRSAFAVLWNREDNQAYEAVVDLTADATVSWTHVPGATPNFTVDEWHECDEAMRAHPDVLAALAARGITDMSLVFIDVWTYGKALMPERWKNRRLGWCDVWVRATPGGNPYAHPVSGVKFIVDMNTMELLQIEQDANVGMPEVQGEYIPGLWTGPQRTDRKPLHITQPEGVSFTVDGTELRWQNWSMRLGFNYREGPVLYQVAYNDHGKVRDIAYRMSFAEMVVPYRDSSFEHYRRTAYDIGEWGLGFMTTSLELGCDCLGEIAYVDAVLHDSTGEPYDITNAICIHEEDNSVLWKHVDSVSGAEVRRMRRLVVSVHCTVANYEYLVYWRFYEDGNIECEVRATGIMVTTPIAEGAAGSAHRNRGGQPDVRAVPPALHRRPTRPRRGRRGEHRAGGRLRGAPGLRRQPVRSGPRRQREADSLGGRGGPGLQLGAAAVLEGGEPEPHQPAGHQHGVQDRPRRVISHDAGPDDRAVPAVARDRPHVMGHPAPRARALARRPLSHPVGARRRHDPLDH